LPPNAVKSERVADHGERGADQSRRAGNSKEGGAVIRHPSPIFDERRDEYL
jgi:hypothetical protein